MNCPLCGDPRRARKVLRAHGVDLVRCRRCALVRVDPFPTAEEALALYDDDYYRDADAGYVDYVADEEVFRAEFRDRLHRIRAAVGRGALLDIGCASGVLLAEARAQGFEPSGIEPAPDMARHAAERSGCPVHAASLDDALLAPAHLDVVTMFEVLEHLTDPVAALHKLSVALRPGGLLAVSVPDFGGWWARLSGARWPFITPWEHLLYFTRRTLRAALLEAGFERVAFHPARTPVSWGTLAARAPGIPRVLPAALRLRGLRLPSGALLAFARAP